MTKETLVSLGVSEEIAERVLEEMGEFVPKSDFDTLRCELALTKAGVKSVKLALPLMDPTGDLEEQISRLREDQDTKLLFEAGGIRGVSPGEAADAAYGIDQATFEQNKHDARWINRNWAQISDALANGRIQE